MTSPTELAKLIRARIAMNRSGAARYAASYTSEDIILDEAVAALLDQLASTITIPDLKPNTFYRTTVQDGAQVVEEIDPRAMSVTK